MSTSPVTSHRHPCRTPSLNTPTNYLEDRDLGSVGVQAVSRHGHDVRVPCLGGVFELGRSTQPLKAVH